MAEADKLWFELGVRDNLSKVLDQYIDKADKLGKALDAATANFIGDSMWKDVYKNAAELEQVFDKLSVTIDHVGVAQNRASGKSAEELGKMKDKLVEMRDTFTTLYEQMKKKPSAFGEKDIISIFELVEGMKLATTQAERYSKEAMNVANVNDKMYEKALSDLEKFNTQWEKMNSGESRQAQLIREMKEQIKAEKEMADVRAKQTADSTEFRDMANESYWRDRARESAAVYQEEFAREEKINQILRERQEMQAHRQEREAAHAKQDEDETVSQEVVDQINKEIAQRKELQKNLDQNESSYKALNKVKLDVESQQKIAVIRNQTAEYRALAQKLADVEALMKKVKAEEVALSSGTISTPTYTRDRITEELEVIQRRYNETLARGRQAELNDADAKRKNADATRRATEAAREMNRVNADMVNSFNRVLDKVTHANKMMGQLQQQFAGYVGLYGMERLLKSVIQVGGEFEVQHIALQSILGDVQQANSMFEQMKELAVVSPFNFRQLAGYSKQIAAFGIPYEEMYDTTKRLADMAAGLGVDMGRLILAYGQVRSAAVLRGQELRQFTEAGIPMVQALAQEFTKLNGRAVSTAEVFELISKRAVPFEMVKKVLWDMTNEGGRFYDMQFTLSDTLAGKWSNLQDAWEIMLSDFAKGESLSGQFLKAMVSGLTALIEAANTLTPLLAGGGLFILMRKANNAMNTSGLAGIDTYITKAQRLQAIELRRRLINQEITREQYNQGMAMNNSQSRYYLLLAQEGKLKNYQIQRLLNQKKINNARLQELVASKELTMREAAQVRLWRMKNGEMSALQMRMNNLVGGVGRFLKANIWMLVIDAAITTLTTWNACAEETEAKNKELTDGFKNVAKEIGDYYSSINGETLSSDEDYKRGIDGLKELLKQHSANYGAIIRETEALDGLEAQYNHLKIALYEEKQITEEAEDKAESFGDATRKAFEDAKESALYITRGRQSFWDVMLGADTDVERGLENSIKKLREKIVEIIPDVGNNEHANELYRKLRNSLEDQLGFGSKEKMLINIKLNELFHIDNIEDATALVVDKFGEMIAQAEPEIANKIRYGQELNQAEKDKVQQLVNDAAEETKKKYPYYADTLQGLLNDSNFVANIRLAFSTSGTKVNDLQKLVYGNMPEYLDEKVKNIATNWATSGNSFDAQNAAKKDLDASKNEKVARQKQADIAKKNLESARKRKATNDEIRKLENQERIANQRLIDITTQHNNEKEAARYGLGYDYDGELKKSNKGTSGSKKDAELEGWKNRLRELQEFWREYEQLRKRMGNADAIETIRESGVFPSMFNNNGELLTDVRGGLVKALRDFMKTTDASTPDRKKFQNEILKSIFNVSNKDAEEMAQKMLKQMQEALARQSSQFDLYKQIMSQTGNVDLAMNAFVDGKVWNDQARSMAATLQQLMSENVVDGGLIRIDWDADEETAEQYYKSNFKNGNVLYELWQAIARLIRDNYVNGLKESASAAGSLLTEAEKVKKIEGELAELRRQGVADNDPRMLQKQKELEKAQADAIERSTDYLRFYEAILSMTIPEAEAIGQKIRQNLNKELQNGTKTANQYLREIKNIDAQMKKLREHQGGLSAFLTGGINGYLQNKYDAESDKFSRAAIDYQKASEQFLAAQKAGDIAGMEQAKNAQSAAKSMMDGAGAAMEGLQGAMGTVSVIDKIIHGIDGVVQGIKGTFDEIREMYEALGHDTNSESWQDWNTFLSSFSAASASATKGWDSLKNGDMGGVIQGVVGSFTGWITGFAKGHDAKRERLIQLSQEQINAINRMKESLERSLERTLGGIYSLPGSNTVNDSFTGDIEDWKKIQLFRRMGLGLFAPRTNISDETIHAMEAAQQSRTYYDQSYALLLKQRDELQAQYNAEADKKDSDSEKLADYKAEIEGLQDSITHFAEDMAKTLYDIDFKSWASELGDALVSAWAAGESGAEAYKNKVSDILRSLGAKMITERFVAGALEPIMDGFLKQYEQDNGVLTKDGMEILGRMYDAGETLQQQVNDFMNGLDDVAEAHGSNLKDSDSSSSVSSGIKGVTEQTADLLASYINAIRADVSVNRIILTQILASAQTQNEMPTIARAQLAQLQQIAGFASRNADAAEMIYELLHRISPDGTSFKIK